MVNKAKNGHLMVVSSVLEPSKWTDGLFEHRGLKVIYEEKDTTWIRLSVAAGCHSYKDTVTCEGRRDAQVAPAYFIVWPQGVDRPTEDTPEARNGNTQDIQNALLFLKFGPEVNQVHVNLL